MQEARKTCKYAEQQRKIYRSLKEKKFFIFSLLILSLLVFFSVGDNVERHDTATTGQPFVYSIQMYFYLAKLRFSFFFILLFFVFWCDPSLFVLKTTITWHFPSVGKQVMQQNRQLTANSNISYNSGYEKYRKYRKKR